jgi:hypothetical protein
VMLRTQGIPARVASGFAPGTFDSRERVWNVNESDAHSWTEVYFPGYGWYTFEPSAARSVPERFEVLPAPTLQGGADRQDGLGDDGFLDDLPTSGSGESVPGSGSPTPSGLLLLALSAALLLTGTGLLSLSTFWERGLGREVPARRRYAQLGRVLGLGGWRPPPSSTPFELATELEHRQPGLRPYLRRLVERYVAVTYGRPFPDESDAQVEVAWRRLRLPLFQIYLKSRIRRSQGQFPAATLPGDELSSDTPGRPSGA